MRIKFEAVRTAQRLGSSTKLCTGDSVAASKCTAPAVPSSPARLCVSPIELLSRKLSLRFVRACSTSPRRRATFARFAEQIAVP